MKKIVLFISLCLAFVMIVTSCGGNSADNTEAATDKNTEPFARETEAEDVDLFESGQKYKSENEFDKAIDTFKKVIENDPQDHLSYLELADIYIRQTDFVSAYDILNEGYDVTGNDSINNKLTEFNYANVIRDSDGNIKGKSRFDGDILSWYHVYEYDSETGLRKTVSYHGADGTEVSHVDISYNDQAQPLTGYAYYAVTGELEKIEFEYNSAGQIAKTNEYTTDGTLLGYSINEFDADGNKISEERFYADGNSHWKLEYIHDAAALESKCFTYFYGTLVGETNYTYNENGYQSSSQNRFKGEYDRTIEYDFDYEGNHERVEVFSGDTPDSRTVCYCAELSVLY